MSRLTTGKRGEEIAVKTLKKRGYKIIDRNVRLASGEVDIIARQKRTVVFVEVKTRTSDRFGSPAAAVDAAKQRKLTRLAAEWLQAHRLEDAAARFDVVSVVLDGRGGERVEVFENAFEAQYWD